MKGGRGGGGESDGLLVTQILGQLMLPLQQLPHSNAVWNGDNLYLLPSINVAIRLLSRGRLISTPVISGADRASVENIISLIEAARDGTFINDGAQEEAAFM